MKYEYKHSGIDWIGDVPEHWMIDRLKDITSFNPGLTDNIDDEEMVTIIPMECVSEWGIVSNVSYQTFEDANKSLSLFKVGDVLFAKITPCMENGKGAFISRLETKIALGSTEFFVLRPHHG
ncbi:MAG: restriction endonuclease subunit S, partial [Bacteroidales bacterium]|nr:restriction endonuclease subunit S [Bacteroidales bacterium]